MFHSVNLPAVSLLLALLLVSSCTSLYINPPGPERQTLLVLPVEINNVSHSNYGFHYIYEIKHIDGIIAPYQATFKLPLKGNMLIVDSLPPGDYYVDKFISRRVNKKISTWGNETQDRHDRFKLEAGSITVFSQSLDVKIIQIGGGNSRYIFTTYSTNMTPLTPIQKTKIIAALKQLEHYDKWLLLNGEGQALVNLEEQLLNDGYKRLNADEIQATFSGNTLYGSFGTDNATIYLATDGLVRGKTVSSSGVDSRDQGTWEISAKGLFCDRWDFWQAGTDCDRVYVRGNSFVLINLDGTKSSEGKIEPGNHSDL